MTLDLPAEFEGLPAEFSAALLVAAEAADSSDDAIASTSLNGTITSWNPAAERLYGWTAAETIGQNIEMIVPEAQRTEHSMIMDRFARGERIDHLETTRSRKDDFRAQVSLTISPINDADGQVVGAIWIAHDITGRQRSEQIRAQLAAIVESAEDAVLSTDLKGYVTSWNGSAERLYGYSATEMVGRFYGEILEGEELEDFEQVFARLMAGERLSYHETTRSRRDGTKFDVSMNLSPIFAPDGSIVGSSAILHDITARKQRERDLAEDRALIEQAGRLGHFGGWAFAIASNGPLICTSEVFRIMGTAERPSVTLEEYFSHVHPDDLERVRSAALSAIVQQKGHYELEHRIVRPDGTQRWVFMTGEILADATGVPVELVGVVQDITDRRAAEEKARSVEKQLRLLAENSRDLIFRYRILPDPGFEFVSPASVVLTGYTPDEFYAQPKLIDRLVDPSPRDLWLAGVRSGRAEPASDVELVRKDGSRIWVNQSLGAVLDTGGEVVAIDGITRDISGRKAAELQLEHEVLHDPLTGLPNRVLLMDRIEHGLSRAARENESVALLLIDLDRFKAFNDTRGHSFGDAVLGAVATRLVASLRPADTVGRFSGNEFVVVCEKLLTGADALKIADHTLNSFAAPFDIAGEEVHVTASIGIAMGKEGQSADKLLRDADLAMHRAKELGRARYEVVDDTLRAEAEWHSTIETGLRRGLDKHEFALAFQPVWSIIEERFVGAEALLRWHDQELGAIGPADFIPVAEDCGLIVPIGEWVLEQACNSLALANRAKFRETASTMSVNVSAVQLQSSDFIRALEELISATGIEPKLLCLEITESMLMGDVDYFSKVLHELRAIGTRLSIDDFGTGYSSLAYLRRFPVDELKIDQSFIAGMDSDPYDATLVAAVIAIGEALGLRVIAEGVETAEELTTVRDLGCQYVQGYFFARPCGFDEYMEYLKSGRPGG
jgi:diguanylate cyclase (GGDEF)-like protein/PAS domain S-box-containing protein